MIPAPGAPCAAPATARASRSTSGTASSPTTPTTTATASSWTGSSSPHAAPAGAPRTRSSVDNLGCAIYYDITRVCKCVYSALTMMDIFIRYFLAERSSFWSNKLALALMNQIDYLAVLCTVFLSIHPFLTPTWSSVEQHPHPGSWSWRVWWGLRLMLHLMRL